MLVPLLAGVEKHPPSPEKRELANYIDSLCSWDPLLLLSEQICVHVSGHAIAYFEKGLRC